MTEVAALSVRGTRPKIGGRHARPGWQHRVRTCFRPTDPGTATAGGDLPGGRGREVQLPSPTSARYICPRNFQVPPQALFWTLGTYLTKVKQSKVR